MVRLEPLLGFAARGASGGVRGSPLRIAATMDRSRYAATDGVPSYAAGLLRGPAHHPRRAFPSANPFLL